MSRAEEIKTEIRQRHDIVEAETEIIRALRQELAEINCPYKVGQRVRCRKYTYEITSIRPDYSYNYRLYGRKIRKNGELNANDSEILTRLGLEVVEK